MTKTISDDELEAQVGHLLEKFYSARVAALQKLELKKVLLKKNPYLYRATSTNDASELVKALLDATISSSDETIFGNEFFEPLALWVASEANSDDPTISARVSSASGVDVEVETATRISMYAVKSGPNVFNAASKRRQLQEFDEARSRLFKVQKQFDAVIAIGYGRRNSTVPRGHRELLGQQLWEELSGEADFYKRIISAMGEQAPELVADYRDQYDRATNRFTLELLAIFADADGALDWEALAEYNSAAVKTSIKWAKQHVAADQGATDDEAGDARP